MHKSRGKLIVFEGGDRSGKTTQSRLLQQAIPDSVLLRYPDRTTPLGQLLNSFLAGKTEFTPAVSNLLFIASLWQTLEEANKHLDEGRTVIMDRYTTSCFVYSLLRGVDPQQLKTLLGGMPEPTVTFFLDVDPKQSSQRGDFGQEIYDSVEYQTKVRNEFLKIPRDFNWITIDAAQSIEAVQANILQNIN